MNLNILGYVIYLFLTVWIILRVGHQLYRNGIQITKPFVYRPILFYLQDIIWSILVMLR